MRRRLARIAFSALFFAAGLAFPLAAPAADAGVTASTPEPTDRRQPVQAGGGGADGPGLKLAALRENAAKSPSPGPQSDGPRRWLRLPVSFRVDKYPVDRLLREFAASQGVAVGVSELLSGTVSGDFSFDDPAEFLDIICRAQQINWYFDGGKAYFFAASELETRMLSLEGKNESQLRFALNELGLFDSRFAWRTADGGRILLAQGPAVYLDRVSEVLEKQREVELSAYPRRKLEVFRLRHAWATERTIRSGDADVTVPGVADLLRKLLSEAGGLLDAEARTAPTPPGDPRFRKGTGVIGRAGESGKGAQPVAAAESGASRPVDGSSFVIQADPRLNAIMVWDYEENMPRHRAIIETLDQPLELVEIRAAIVDVETTRTRDLGISWSVGDNQGGSWRQNAGAGVAAGDNFTSVVGGGFNYATIYTRGLDQFMARVSALEKEGDANILSRPSVLTQDNIQATLEHTETFYVRIQGYQEVDLADITTGLTLRVTPHVIQGEGGAVQLAVYIADGSDSNTANNVDNLPRVRQSTISTQAVVREGEALIIGGYYNETRRLTDTGVPGLKNIPILGALFRGREKVNDKTERLFVLSPRIIHPGQSPMLEGTEAERAFSQSPAREVMDGPAAADAVIPVKERPLWPRSRKTDRK